MLGTWESPAKSNASSYTRGLGFKLLAVNIHRFSSRSIRAAMFLSPTPRRTILMLAASLTLAGCGLFDFGDNSAGTLPAPPKDAPAAPAAAPERTTRLASPPPARPAAPAAPDLKLVGLSQAETEVLIGP